MKLLLIIIPLFLNLTAFGRTLTLSDALTKARQQSRITEKYRNQRDAAVALGNKFNGAFDTSLHFNYQQIEDKGDLSSPSNGNQRNQFKRDMKVSKFLPTGTYIELNSQWNQQKVKYDTDPSLINPLFAPSYNPEHQILYGITVRQSLWQNFWAGLIKLQQRVGLTGAISPSYQLEVELQNIQGLVENYYWQLISLNQQQKVTKQLIEKSRLFVKSMKNRARVGRADDVDIASAEAALVQHEGLLVNVENGQSQIRTHLKHLLYGVHSSKKVMVPPRLPTRPPKSLKYRTAFQAMKMLPKHRLDIQMIRKLQSATDLKVDLAEESLKPKVDLFASYQKRGIGGSASDSAEDLNNGDITAIGITVDWSIEGKAARQDRLAASFEKKQLLGEEAHIVQTVSREIDAAYKVLQGTDRQISLKNSQISSLNSKKEAEKRKLSQARSDDVAVYRYEIEIQMAMLEKIEAQANKMLQTAKIKTLLHDYPTSKATTK